MIVGSATGVRLVELFFLCAWAAGFWLVWKHSRRTLLLGVYLGCTLSWTHDWMLASPQIWRMDFHPDTIWIAHWGGRPEGLWAPLSYGAFFGIGAFLWLKHLDRPLQARFGPWRYLMIFPAAFVGNVIVEGTIIEWGHTNRYQQASGWLLFNIPWLHLVTTGIMFGGIILGAAEGMRVLEHFGWRELEPQPAAAVARERALVGAAATASPPAPAPTPAEREVPKAVRRAMFLVGVALPQAAFTAATMVGLYLYDWLDVPT